MQEKVGTDALLTFKVLDKRKWDPGRQTDGIGVELEEGGEKSQS